MAESKLAKKMQIKSGYQMRVICPPSGYIDRLDPVGFSAELEDKPTGFYDVVHLFVKNSTDLKQEFPNAFKSLKPEGLFWISYPKRTSKIKTDLTRDAGWKIAYDAGLRPVRQVSIDDDWSAVRFRVPEHTSEKDLIESQYQGKKAHLKPIYECIVQLALESPGGQLMVIKPSTITRVDLGLKLKGVESEGRLQSAGALGSGSMTHKISISNLEEVDAEVIGWLKLACEGVA